MTSISAVSLAGDDFVDSYLTAHRDGCPGYYRIFTNGILLNEAI